ncbi:TOX high mobility group box family member 4-A [Lampris incognitus]|uniref:TOX high mobility group box family member 4-A n=1 Tax=Lampris incognitus TaxID=2546036 RepID=UPI0024B4A0BD|nr:TOX high mobility group box family member 4-A [Lampris incognitus]
MDLNFYSDLSGGCAQNGDPEFLDTQGYSEYSDNKFPGNSDSYLTITGSGHPFLSAEQTFHTPNLGDEVFEIPPISLDPDTALSHFGELSEGAGGPSGSDTLVSNLVVGANDPSFASTFVNPGTQGLEHLNLGVAGGGALLSSSVLEMDSSNGSHFNSSSPMTIDVQLGEISTGLLGSSHLATINQSELGLGLCSGNMLPRSNSPEQTLSAKLSPAESLQDEDMDNFRSVLVDSPMSLSSPAVPSNLSSHLVHQSNATVAASQRDGGKPAAVVTVTVPAGGKKGRKKKDPNEPQKPVSAYALFFRDTQAAIKGQNPNASFGEVSKIVASMWDSLAEEQKQVYKRKTEAAKKEYLKALAAYRANQLSQTSSEVMETIPPSPPPVVNPTPAVPLAASTNQPARQLQNSVEENTITNICASNIILDVPEVTTRSRTGANKTSSPAAVAPPTQTITKIIISKHMLQAGGHVVTLLPGGVRALQPAVMASMASRQPPPLQQMQNAPPPPRLQQMAPAPPPLQAKPREGGITSGLPVSITTTPPPPLQIKIVPASVRGNKAMPIIVTTATAASPAGTMSSVITPSIAMQLGNSADLSGNPGEVLAEVLPTEEVEMELNESSDASSASSVCVRAGCNNPAVESKDWDKEYCSNECVATHCRDIFMAWCSIKNQSMGTVK